MNKLRDSVHSANQVWLREVFIARRQELGLSQRALAEKIGVIYSLIGKIDLIYSISFTHNLYLPRRVKFSGPVRTAFAHWVRSFPTVSKLNFFHSLRS